jgi:hypothetical protein
MSEGNWSEKNATTLVAKSAYNAVVAQNKRYRGALEEIASCEFVTDRIGEAIIKRAKAALKDKE